jgi:hypothetical protein
MRLPKINMDEQGWPQFLVGMLIVSPTFGAFIAGRWAATTLPYSIALSLGIAAAVLSWLFTTAMAVLLDHRRSTLVSLSVIEGVFTRVSFSTLVFANWQESCCPAASAVSSIRGIGGHAGAHRPFDGAVELRSSWKEPFVRIVALIAVAVDSERPAVQRPRVREATDGTDLPVVTALQVQVGAAIARQVIDVWILEDRTVKRGDAVRDLGLDCVGDAGPWHALRALSAALASPRRGG